MAFIYEVNGQKVEFASEPSDADIDEAARSMGTAPSTATANINPTPQTAGAVRAIAPEVAAGVKQGAQAIGNMPWQTAARGAADIGSMMAGHPPYASMIKMGTDAVSGTPIKEVLGNAGNAVRGGAGALLGGARNVGSALVSGAVAPESALMMPYQMAAYEQEKIRANPTAPEYATNPYAQTYRGEYATQGQAGAANARNAVINAPYGNVSAADKALLDEDKARKMRLQMQVAAAKRVLGQ